MSCFDESSGTADCVPSVGLMDGTVFREALLAMKGEPTFAHEAAQIEDYMQQRAVTGINGNVGWQDADAPHGSEFNWDTTGQEEVAIWGAHFKATSSDRAPCQFGSLNDRAVDAILAYDPWSATWAYHGSAAGWGDFSNNGKWMVEGGWEREGGHHRAGLNAIPLIERFRAHPDDIFLLEVAMGGMTDTGVLSNIDSDGAASMGYHCYPSCRSTILTRATTALGFLARPSTSERMSSTTARCSGSSATSASCPPTPSPRPVAVALAAVVAADTPSPQRTRSTPGCTSRPSASTCSVRWAPSRRRR